MRTIFSSLRSRLILLIVIAFIPIIGLLVQTSFLQRAQAVAAAEREVIHLANTASNMQEVMGSNIQAFLLTVAHNPEVRRQDMSACQDLYAHLITDHFNYYSSFYVADLEGNILCSPAGQHDSPNFHECDHYRTLVKAKDFVVSDYHICKQTGLAVLSIGLPIQNMQGERVMVTNVSFDLAWFSDFASDADMPEGSELILVDRQGTILSHYPDNERWRGFSLPATSVVRQLYDRKAGSLIGNGLIDNESVFAISSLTGAMEGIHVIMGWPTRIAFAEANNTLLRSLLSLLVVMVVMIFITWKLGYALIIKQTQALLQATRRLEQGDLTVRAEVDHSQGELGELGQAFNSMANQLAIREAERDLHEQQLNDYAHNLEVSNKELSDFAFIASHDLQEPLRKIQVFSQLLDEHCASVLPEREAGFLKRMNESAQRMQMLIAGLLAFSRVTTKVLPFAQVDLNQVVRLVLVELDWQIEEKKAQVQVSSLPVIEADTVQMSQLFQNLISNAIKFHKKDCPPVVRISSARLGGSTNGTELCEIRVTDEGIGFDEKYLDRIFQPFQRLNVRDDYDGMGMGLAICRKIVILHSGVITASSRPGMGATFIIRLPVTQRNER